VDAPERASRLEVTINPLTGLIQAAYWFKGALVDIPQAVGRRNVHLALPTGTPITQVKYTGVKPNGSTLLGPPIPIPVVKKGVVDDIRISSKKLTPAETG